MMTLSDGFKRHLNLEDLCLTIASVARRCIERGLGSSAILVIEHTGLTNSKIAYR